MENLAEDNYPREFNLIEVLSIAWSVFTKNYFKLFGFIFAIAFPIALINAMIIQPKMIAFSTQIATLQNDPQALLDYLLSWNDVQTSMLLVLVSLLNIALFAVVSKAVNTILFETDFNPSSIVLSILKQFPFILITAILVGLMSIFGLFFFIIPGVLAYVYYYFAIIASSTENKGIIYSLSRSSNLVKGRFLMTFVFILFFFLLSLITTSVLSIINSLVVSQFVQIMLEFISGIVSAYFIVVYNVLFINYRDTAHFYRPQIAQE